MKTLDNLSPSLFDRLATWSDGDDTDRAVIARLEAEWVAMNNALMFSKASDEWSTPQEFYDALHAEFSFRVDAAATEDNAKCRLYYSAEKTDGWLTDALGHYWLQVPHWCNPPYSKCREFIAKAAQERLRGVLTVMLVPSRTDTRWFHEHVWDAQTHRPRPGIEVRFIKGRLKFGGAAAGAPFPSMVIVFRP